MKSSPSNHSHRNLIEEESKLPQTDNVQINYLKNEY